MEQAKLLCQMAATTWRPAVALTLLSIVYIAGFWLPVAWTDPAMLKDNDYQMLARHMTLFAVGSFSWMIAILLVEVLTSP